jgi:putative FmdB family regulatory protein
MEKAMPFYEYECESCKFYTELLQKVSDAPLKKCPSCGKNKMKKLVSAPVFRLKGGGWYETDFKGDKENKRNLAVDKEPDSSTDSKPAKSDASDAKTESKSESKPVESKSEGGPSSGSSSAARSGSRKAQTTRSSSSSASKSRAKPAAKAKAKKKARR